MKTPSLVVAIGLTGLLPWLGACAAASANSGRQKASVNTGREERVYSSISRSWEWQRDGRQITSPYAAQPEFYH